MTRNDFLIILESFPGRAELANADKAELIEKFSSFDFFAICKLINKRKLNLFFKKDEESWLRFISFFAIGVNLWPDYEVPMPPQERLLTWGARNEAELICRKFNADFNDGVNCIMDVTAISLEQLIAFAKSEETLF